MSPQHAFALASAALLQAVSVATPAPSAPLSTASVVCAGNASPIERLAARMLVEEGARRGARWRVVTALPAAGHVISLGSVKRRPATPGGWTLSADTRPEGYRLAVASKGGRTTVTAVGNDERGCMFAAGQLLRSLEWGNGKVSVPLMHVSTSPAKPMRGHQLGWRPTANSYDRWGLKEYEQYIRDLIVWGVNAIELIPFDGAYDREKNARFTCALADLIASYGLDVWLWYPIADEVPEGMSGPGLTPGQLPCPSEAAGRKFVLDGRRALFSRMKHLDGVLIPGGDPGGCKCPKCTPWVNTILPLAEEVAGILHRYHPKAGLWLSNQGFLEEHNEAFYRYLSSKKPRWLAGVVHAPWVEETVASMRKRTPSQYPIRQYPDICHCVRCQYPAPDWDQAYASTLGREPVIYRPSDHAHIARLYQPLTCGAITYSDGVTDDLNKVIWSAMLWDPKQSDRDVVREYARYFFGSNVADDAVRGIYLLEANWRAPADKSKTPSQAFGLWRRLERQNTALTRGNWRFQMALLRAYYDRYVQVKLQAEISSELALLADLRRPADPRAAARQALEQLDAQTRRTPAADLRQRLLELGQDLFESIGLQLSVPRWGASGSERGAVLDFLDVPLRNQDWIRSQLRDALNAGDAAGAAAAIRRIVDWEDPGPGGFYDDLGDPSRQPHLQHARPWRDDPGYVETPRTDFAIPQPGYRQSWVHYAESLYGAPIELRYTGLDPRSRYVVRATYSGRYRPTLELWADGKWQIHGPVQTTVPPTIAEWPVPPEATADGSLALRWTRTAGRGAQVSEVWLMRKGTDAR